MNSIELLGQKQPIMTQLCSVQFLSSGTGELCVPFTNPPDSIHEGLIISSRRRCVETETAVGSTQSPKP